MTSGLEGPASSGPALDRGSGDDTIELELTADQELALARAVAAPRADELDASPTVPGYTNFAFRPTARIEFVCNVTLAVLALGLAIAFLWPRSVRHPAVPVVMPVVASTAPVAEVNPAPPPPISEPAGSPVRITNSFDASEVFEFPHGTTVSEARQAVAELLLSRARERRAQGLTLKRAIKSSPRVREAAMQRSPVPVTRLLAGAKTPVDDTD